ncbi:MAG TPA: SRPBCC family protein [Caulobacteraceae bacterium]|jgi:uncharacterized protein YndB with AHSA1/START domain|nr:SRPBCC family protein [Caulobacteraceae bacterium]
MTTDIAHNGVIRQTDDGYEIRFVRRLRKPIEKVWAALTVPERIADWFTEMRFIPEPQLGARVELQFPEDDPPIVMANGEVIAFEPPRLFAWTWPDADHPPGSVVRCELAPDGDGCILTFTESNRRGAHQLVWGAAGWHIFLDGLEGATEGVANRWTMQRELALRPSYQAQFDALMAPDGEVRLNSDGYEIVFVRRLSKPVEKVWAALTVPERIADWLAPATIDPDLRVGARFNLDFGDGKHRTAGEIVALQPGRLFAWTWPASADERGAVPTVVRFELAPAGQGCKLTLTSRGPGLPHPGELAGWHTHLEGLEGAADGVRTPLNLEHEAVHERRYEAALASL